MPSRQTSSTNSNTPFTRYNRLSNRLYNRFDNRLYRVNKHPTSCQTGGQTGLYNRFDSRLYTRYSRLSNWLSNGFDNRLNVCIHDTTGCQTGLTTGFTTGLNGLYLKVAKQRDCDFVKFAMITHFHCVYSVDIELFRT